MGALTSQPYRFRARPWDIESSGSVCTMCPSPVQRDVYRRDERAARARRATTPNAMTAGCATAAASPTSPSTSTSA